MKQRGFVPAFGLVVLLSLPVSAADAPTLTKDVQPIFDRACTDCHNARKTKAKLNLSAATAGQALVNAPSDQVPQMVRVKPGDPEASYLWLKVQHRAEKGKGMPRGLFGSKHLPAADLEIIKRWIEAGAAK